MTDRLDIAANRRAAKWTRRELFRRFLWELVQPILRLIPRQFWGLRRGVLRLFGARVGREVRIHRTVRIAIPWNLTIDDEAAIGDRVQIAGVTGEVASLGLFQLELSEIDAGTEKRTGRVVFLSNSYVFVSPATPLFRQLNVPTTAHT